MSDENRPEAEAPRPRYGEYAPGHTPGTPSAPPAQDQPAWAPPTQHRPASPGAPAGTPQGSAPAWSVPARPRRRGDLIATIILLVVGLGGALIGCLYGAVFTDPDALNAGLAAQGRPGFHGTVGAAPAVIIGSHILLYLLAVGLSVLALVKRRIAFWIPLVAGVVAAIVFWVTVFAVFTSDPTFLQQFSQPR